MEPRSIGVKSYKEWNFDLKVNFKGLFKAVAQAFASKILVDPKIGIKAATDGLDAVQISIDHGVSYRAYHLIFSAIQRAMLYLVESPDHTPAIADAIPHERFPTYDATVFQAMVDDMQALFDNTDLKEFKIYETFFQHPEQLTILVEVRVLFEDWLQRVGLTNVQASHIGGRLATVFVRMLNEVWREKPADYVKIREKFEDVFPESHLHERTMYNLKLKEEWERPVFDETFGLDKIYIPLRAGYFLKKKKGEEGRSKKFQVVDAESQIKAWVYGDQPEYKMLVLKGGPGSGKSSLMKKLAYDLSLNNRFPVFFIELQHFQLDTNVEAATEAHFIRTFSEKVFSKNAVGSAKHPILIFDGLDELSNSDKTGLEIAKMLVDELVKLTDRLTLDGWEPRVIITGRDLLIQAYERNFNEEGQVLEMLPYRLKTRSSEIEYSGEKKLLQAPQLEQWWKTYLELKNVSSAIPEFLSQDAFSDLVDQPLLNFLLALTYLRAQTDFGKNANINNVYYDLMVRVLDRPWGKHKHLKWTIEEFLEVMEEVATSAWHTSGDVRTTTMSRVRKHCERNKEVHARILALESNPDSSYIRLMAAFYFRQEGNAVLDKTFEFTHKSFGEYLVARRIVTLVRRIQKGISNPEFYSTSQAMQDWLAICGEVGITEYIWPFLMRQITLEYKALPGEALKIQAILANLFSTIVNDGIELKMLNEETNLGSIRVCRNAESALLLTISAFSKVSGKKSDLKWKHADHLRDFFLHLMMGGEVFKKGLAGVLFPERADLARMDLNGANLEEANLCQCNLSIANLGGVEMSGADMRGADLHGADMLRAQLRSARLNSANMRRSCLSGANLSGADLSRADLVGADLQGADISGADMRRSILRGANMCSTCLRGTDLRDADLRRADLQGADLQGADLSNAVLTCADFSDTNFFPIRIKAGSELIGARDAYDYLISRGARNVPKPKGMKLER